MIGRVMDETYGSRYVLASAVEKTNIKDIETVLANLQSIGRKTNTIVQIADPDYIASLHHIRHATHLALKAEAEDNMVSNEVAVEILLYLVGQRQIDKAIDQVGAKQGKQKIGLIIVGKDKKQVEKAYQEVLVEIGGVRNPALLELTSEKMKQIQELFNITQTEIDTVSRGDDREALIKIVMERSALLDLQK